MPKLRKKVSGLNRCFNSWWFTFTVSVIVLALLVAIAADLVVITLTGSSMWFPHPK